MTLGERIAALRKGLGMTQLELAQMLGVTNQAVSKWESDQCCPDILLLPELADALGTSLDALFGREAPPSAPRIDGLPWGDDGNLRAVCYIGTQLVEHAVLRGASVELHYSGDVGNILSEFSVTCHSCSVRGSIHAGTGISCSEVGGDVNGGSWVQCGDVQGNVSAGNSISCGHIHGNAFAGDSIHCQSVRDL